MGSDIAGRVFVDDDDEERDGGRKEKVRRSVDVSFR